MAITHAKVSTKPDGADTSLVLASDWNDDHVGSLPAGSVAHSDLTGLTTGDDHTQYQKESEKAAANGYASLDSGILVPIAQLPTGTGASQVALGNHGHGGTPAIVLGSAAVAGSAATLVRTDGTIAAFDATNPTTQAYSDSPVVGSAAFAARRDHKHGMPASAGASFDTPAIVLGSAAAAGAASTVIRSDSTIAAFDATAPVTQAFSDAAATGSAAVAARRDHKHGMPASPGGGSDWTGTIVKSSDQTFTSTALANDSELAFTMDASSGYIVEVWILCTDTNGATGYKWQFAIASAIHQYGILGQYVSVTAGLAATQAASISSAGANVWPSAAISVGIAAANDWQPVFARFEVYNKVAGTNTVTLKAAMDSAGGGNAKTGGGSILRYRKMV